MQYNKRAKLFNSQYKFKKFKLSLVTTTKKLTYKIILHYYTSIEEATNFIRKEIMRKMEY